MFKIDKNTRIFKIPLCSKSYINKRSRGEKVLFDLYIVFDTKFLYIKTWYANFLEAQIDLYTTPSHFKTNPKNFRHRKQLLEERLGFKIQERPDRKAKLIKTLDDKQLKSLEYYVNNNYFEDGCTLKGLIYLFKGNNPGGSVTNPSSSEIVSLPSKKDNFTIINPALAFDSVFLDTDDFKYQNLNEFLTINTRKNNVESFNDFLEYIKSDCEFLYNLIKLLNKYDKSLKNQKDIEIKMLREKTLKKSEKYYWFIQYIKDEAKKQRAQYRDKTSEWLVFENFAVEAIEKAHIYNVSWIKRDAIEYAHQNTSWKKSKLEKEINNILSDISNKYNFLNLDATVHKMFDGYKFTFDAENGNQVILDDTIAKNERIATYLEPYKQIEHSKLNNELKKFISKRNDYLSKNGLISQEKII
ncbi:MAG4270 family putative restriction endonuclease [Mycoplasma sp. 128]